MCQGLCGFVMLSHGLISQIIFTSSCNTQLFNIHVSEINLLCNILSRFSTSKNMPKLMVSAMLHRFGVIFPGMNNKVTSLVVALVYDSLRSVKLSYSYRY